MSRTADAFDLYLFVRKCKNLSKWKQIFSASSYDENKCVTFFKTLSQNEGLNKEERQKIEEKDFQDFRRFISDTYVHQMDYDRLLMRIEEKKKGRKDRTYGYDYYLRELPPIKDKQQIIGNFVEIENYSGSLYSYAIEDNVKYKTIYDLVKRFESISLSGNVFYCLEGIGESLKNYVNEETRKVSNPKEWVKENPDKLFILQDLYKKYILNFGVKKGCSHVFDKGDVLYFWHKDYTKDLQHIEGKQVTRLFRDTAYPFVKHEAIEIDVKIYEEDCSPFLAQAFFLVIEIKSLLQGEMSRGYIKFSPQTNMIII